MSHSERHQITLRGIPEKLVRELESEASQEGSSLNRVILKRLSPQESHKGEGACASLLSLAGTWNAERTKEFEKSVKGHRKIDPELWPKDERS